MTTNIIELHKDKKGNIPYLTTILKEIPTNTILCKTLTGLGATYGEIKAKRNSLLNRMSQLSNVNVLTLNTLMTICTESLRKWA